MTDQHPIPPMEILDFEQEYFEKQAKGPQITLSGEPITKCQYRTAVGIQGARIEFSLETTDDFSMETIKDYGTTNIIRAIAYGKTAEILKAYYEQTSEITITGKHTMDNEFEIDNLINIKSELNIRDVNVLIEPNTTKEYIMATLLDEIGGNKIIEVKKNEAVRRITFNTLGIIKAGTIHKQTQFENNNISKIKCSLTIAHILQISNTTDKSQEHKNVQNLGLKKGIQM